MCRGKVAVTDQWTIRMVVVILGAVALVVVVGGMLVDVPDAIMTIGAAAVGAVGSLLARTSTKEE